LFWIKYQVLPSLQNIILFVTKKFDAQFFLLPSLFVSLFAVQISSNKIRFSLSWNLLFILKHRAKRNSQYPIGPKNKGSKHKQKKRKSHGRFTGMWTVHRNEKKKVKKEKISKQMK
jgi:hypothetical protein